MNNKLFSLLFFSLLYFQGFGQNRCGQQIMMQQMEKEHPGSIASFKASQKAAIALAKKYELEKTTLSTTASPIIPVVFHIVLDINQFNALGGTAGIESRVNTQMKVINDDFNGGNADKTKVPSVWTSLYANVGITFGLAHVDPSGNYTAGYEVKIVSNGTSFNSDNGAKDLKFAATGGVNAWDNSKYLNIWVCNLKDFGGITFGVTAPPGISVFTKPEVGVVLNYRAFGSRVSPSDDYIAYIDKGRTLTHELGHFFHIWHIWGETDGCDDDDDISDTPLQASATSGSPNTTSDFPKLDACSPSGNGYMYMNYMDYVNDASMFMFTKGQASVMNAQLKLLGSSYSLTQNPWLNIAEKSDKINFQIFPNPTNGLINIAYKQTEHPLLKLEVRNVLGQIILSSSEENNHSIDLSNQSKGIYFVRCYFEKGIETQKIIVE